METIGKYQIVREIASGAFGRVYQAEDTSNQCSVAIKLLHAARIDSTQDRTSFLEEAKFLTMLKYPYILPLLDVGIDKGFPYLVTEYTPNGSLYNRLKQQAPRPLKVSEGLTILGQVGQALQYAHHQNIIHRDLKPENILFNASGDAVLADFGIATILATSIKYDGTVGTPCYMAPEQFRGTNSKEGDQYALGCIAYELFTGRLPFAAPDFFSLGFKHLSEMPLAPTQLNLLLPRSIEQAILKAMAKQRTDRYPDIATFMNALGVPTPSSPGIAPGNGTTKHLYTGHAPDDGTGTKSGLKEETGQVAVAGKASKAPGMAAHSRSLPEEETGKLLSAASIALPHVLENGRIVEEENYAFNFAPRTNAQSSFSPAYMPVDEPGPAAMSDETSPTSSASGTETPHRHAWNTSYSILVAAIVMLVLVLITGSVLYAMSIPTPVATVVITPGKVSSTYTMTAVTGKPNVAQRQVQARLLSFSTQQQAHSVLTTGQGMTPAVAATGTLVLSNPKPAPQTVPAGTIITNNAGTVSLLTDASVTIPAPVAGQIVGVAKVSAHAEKPGAKGNIPALNVNGTCCSTDKTIAVSNLAAFSGGKDAQPYAAVQQSDLDNAANPLKTSLTQTARTSLQNQMRSGEAQIDTPQCVPEVLYDHAVGKKATNVTAYVTETCHVEVYNKQAALSMAIQLLQTDHSSHSSGQPSKAGIVATLLQSRVSDTKGTIALTVQVASSTFIQFSTTRKQAFAHLIAGKSLQKAQALLLSQFGISHVTLKLSGGDGRNLPTDPTHITITTSMS